MAVNRYLDVRLAGIELIRHSNLKTVQQYRGIFPAVGINGQRQSGKTTMARELKEAEAGKVAYFDLERQADYAATLHVDLFLNSLHENFIVIEEIQRRPELFTGL